MHYDIKYKIIEKIIYIKALVVCKTANIHSCRL